MQLRGNAGVHDLQLLAVHPVRPRGRRRAVCGVQGGVQPETACVRVGVVDFSRVPPVRREPDPERESGRGVALVEQLAEDWGTDPLPWGKM